MPKCVGTCTVEHNGELDIEVKVNLRVQLKLVCNADFGVWKKSVNLRKYARADARGVSASPRCACSECTR